MNIDNLLTLCSNFEKLANHSSDQENIDLLLTLDPANSHDMIQAKDFFNSLSKSSQKHIMSPDALKDSKLKTILLFSLTFNNFYAHLLRYSFESPEWLSQYPEKLRKSLSTHIWKFGKNLLAKLYINDYSKVEHFTDVLLSNPDIDDDAKQKWLNDIASTASFWGIAKKHGVDRKL